MGVNSGLLESLIAEEYTENVPPIIAMGATVRSGDWRLEIIGT